MKSNQKRVNNRQYSERYKENTFNCFIFCSISSYGSSSGSRNLIISIERLLACSKPEFLCSSPPCMAACYHYPQRKNGQCFNLLLFSFFLLEVYNPRLSFCHLNCVFKDIKSTHCPHTLTPSCFSPDNSPEESTRQTQYAFAYMHIFNPPLIPRLLC